MKLVASWLGRQELWWNQAIREWHRGELVMPIMTKQYLTVVYMLYGLGWEIGGAMPPCLPSSAAYAKCTAYERYIPVHCPLRVICWHSNRFSVYMHILNPGSALVNKACDKHVYCTIFAHCLLNCCHIWAPLHTYSSPHTLSLHPLLPYPYRSGHRAIRGPLWQPPEPRCAGVRNASGYPLPLPPALQPATATADPGQPGEDHLPQTRPTALTGICETGSEIGHTLW